MVYEICLNRELCIRWMLNGRQKCFEGPGEAFFVDKMHMMRHTAPIFHGLLFAYPRFFRLLIAR